jgi:hypothetical protein
VILFVGITLLNFSSNKDSLDFSEFYGAAQMVRQGHGKDLYDLDLQAEFQSRVAAVHAVYLRPPFETLLFVPLTYVSYRTAYTLWTLANVAFLALAAFLIESRTGIALAIAQYTRIRADWGLILVIFLTFAPTTTCLLLGQDSILMLLIYVSVFVLMREGADFRAGCLLACGLFKFHLVVPFAAILLFRRKWAALGGFAAIASGLVVLSVAISGPRILREYPRVLFFDSTHRQMMGFHPDFTPNIHGFLYLIAKNVLSASLLGCLVALFSLLALCWAAKNWRNDRFGFSFSGSLVATLLASYHLYNYDLVLVLLPVAVVCGELAQSGHLLSGTPLLTSTLLALFVPPVHFVLVTNGIYALMFVPILLLFFVIVRLNRADSPDERTVHT